MQRIFNFSGGKTSAYMVIKYYQQGDIVLFQDTGREHPKTYKFITDFEAHENIPVTRIKYADVDDPFAELLARKKHKVIPNRVKRVCTEELKIKTAKRYLRSIGIRKFENIIGFRADEGRRVNNRKQLFKLVVDKFPLFEDGITKDHINEYWQSKPYTLEIPSILGNCTLCFMKGERAIMAILMSYPELADVWIEDEEKSNGRQYFKDVTIRTLRDLAQNNLFKNYDLNGVVPQFNCECSGL